ncbi:MAG TPA: arsinothricin resistance N-acetyltransferase ArsN1 family B [Candidatus Acidoferrales bacterium]|nr:arsinothricin resistance N-acetyltransferase ArsN1 family B [Candidatus Acidoferrales bacterium]
MIDIRVASPDDAAAFAAIYAPIVTATHVSFEEVAPTVDEMRARITKTLERTPWLAAVEDGKVIGYAYATRHRERPGYRWAVDVSVYLDRGARGRGIGRTLYERLFAILERQQFRRAYAGIALPNDASIAVHRALGFEPIGVYRRVGWKFDRWYDVAWFGRDIGDARGEQRPAEPIPFPRLSAPRSSPS